MSILLCLLYVSSNGWLTGSLTDRSRFSNNPSFLRVNTGTHSLRLYRPPVPSPGQVPRDPAVQPRDWVRYREATLRFHVFQEVPRPGSLTPSEASDEEEEGLSQVNFFCGVIVYFTVVECQTRECFAHSFFSMGVKE